jgi:methionyl-tRNA formyltransferase
MAQPEMNRTTRRIVKVVAVTQSDPFFTGAFFSSFLQEIDPSRVKVVEIVLLPNFRESKAALVLRLVRLYGLVDFLRLLRRYLVARVDEFRGAPKTVEAIAARRKIPVRRLRTINSSAYLSQLAERRIDVLLSVAAPEIFGKEALAATPLALNVHSGRLPEYRGMMPTFWALYNDDEQIVITVHAMAEKVDSGGVLAEYPLRVEPRESAFELAIRAKRVAGREVARLLARLETDAWPEARPVAIGRGTYYRFPQGTHARRLRSRGRRLL